MIEALDHSAHLITGGTREYEQQQPTSLARGNRRQQIEEQRIRKNTHRIAKKARTPW